VATLIVIAVLVGLGFVTHAMRLARTSARKSSNAAVRRALEVESDLTVGELSDVLTHSLERAGAHESGTFDGTHYFNIRGARQLELRTWASNGHAHATVVLPTVRSSNGRPEKISSVGALLYAVARAVRELDRTARIN
jgi:hypothetical protein